MKQEHHSSYRSHVDMGQHPVSQRACTPAINLLAHRIRHYNGNAGEPDDAGEPTHRQPRASEHAVKPVSREPPDNRQCAEDSCEHSADVPGASQRIALVNVSAHCVSLISKDKTLGG